jgi:mono/diheme cytochrome c family protein
MKLRAVVAVFALSLSFGSVLSAWAGEPDQGQKLYLQYCSSCHGKDGSGSGSVSSYFKVKVPNLTLLKKINKGIYPTARVLSSIDGSRAVRAHGEREMPVWGQVFRQEHEKEKYPELTALLKAKAIAEYVSTLQK